ncbi:SDR family oxidoreductase [Scleromatobacter humisilvae]|uniref:Aldehyde reductase n=1 Tax=Scleromatobacter humisilvae TaxID=2897159 RepID=A0A9X1YL67_9BURK|nr:aldehyde reductase [Scleromatobacter humisilvae]MCK9686773.1 aldehyde reductase [Scleromatobacter humisilvae]
MSGELVLVTGGSGFIATHCILQLLAAGHRVRTTVRSLKREPEVRATLKAAGADAGDRLAFFAADLTADAGWAAAAAGCDFVQHVASPFPINVPRHEDELIVPAREGALRVLRAARDAGVKRVVQTSSFAAVGYGHPQMPRPFNEHDWTHVDGPGLTAYAKSKTLAERAAWDFMAREGGAMELAVVNPVGVFGPVLGADFSTSIEIVKRLMDGAVPALPRITFGVVDVRDVADLHLKAMTAPEAAGERFLAVAGDFLSMHDIAMVLKNRLGDAARRVPTRELPDWLVRTVALVDKSAGQIVPELGKRKNATSEKARRTLGWSPRSAEDALVATAESLARLGLLKR